MNNIIMFGGVFIVEKQSYLVVFKFVNNVIMFGVVLTFEQHHYALGCFDFRTKFL